MILPSEDDSRKPGDADPPSGPGGAPEWPGTGGQGEAEEGPAYFGEAEEDDDAAPYGDGEQIEAPAPPGWREELKETLIEAVDDLRQIEDPGQDFDPPEPPDLFTFYGELAALKNDMRRGARRTAEALEKLAGGKQEPDSAIAAQPLAMALVYLYDRVASGGGDAKFLPLVESAMQQAGIERVVTSGKAFDAATMVAESTSLPAGGKVEREVEAGFLWCGQLLRPARVVVVS